MPAYDYQCPECKEVHTIVHPMDEVQKRKCAKCGVELRKKFGSPPVTFKGNGFYTNDKFL